MSKHQILEFTSIRGQAVFVDATRIEAVVESDNDSLQSAIVTGSDTYNVQCEAPVAAQMWKDAL